MKKKTKVIIVSVVLVLALIAGSVAVAFKTSEGKMFGTIAEVSDRIKINATISSDPIKIGDNSVVLSEDVKIDTSWAELTSTDNYAEAGMRVNAAKLAFLMALDALDICRVNGDDDEDNTSFPLSLGFEESDDIVIGADKITYITHPEKSYTVATGEQIVNENDTTRMVISYSKYDFGCGEKSYYINVSFSGTDETCMNEWFSNFDIGSTNDDLYKTSKEGWVVKENHKGFDVAATRSINAIFKYIEGFCDPKESNLVFNINGYSRGAAIANIVAMRLKDDLQSKYNNLFCIVNGYTFATPTTTTKEVNAVAEKNIYNFVGQQDTITNVPTTNMGFRRYGTDYSFSLVGDENAEIRSKYEEYSTQTLNVQTLPQLIIALGNMCSGRDDYYTVNSSDATICKTYQFSELSEANEKRAKLSDLFSELCPENKEMYYNISEVTKTGNTYSFVTTVAPSFVGQLLPYGLGAAGASKCSLSISDYGNELASMQRYTSVLGCMQVLSWVNPNGIKLMHLPCQYLAYLNTLGEIPNTGARYRF